MHRKMRKYNHDVLSVRSLSKVIILQTLENKSQIRDDLMKVIKQKLPENCNDGILCICTNGNGKPEWMHQVRWSLNDLKRSGKVSYDITFKKYHLLQ